MRAVLQRVLGASVKVDGKKVAEIGEGLSVLACAMKGDKEKDVQYIANKLSTLRIFNDDQGKMNRSLLDAGGECLLVSQFTLAAETRKGRRPSYVTAMEPLEANRMVDKLKEMLQEKGINVDTGIFGADMKIKLLCDGPVTVWIDSS